MQIVIDISPLTHQYIEKGYRTADVAEELFTAVQKGIPLPKGHGRLIDSKDAYKKFYNRSMAKIGKEVLDETPTIIEADKEQKDGNVD